MRTRGSTRVTSAMCQERTLGVAGKRRFDPASSFMVVVMAIGLLVIGVL
jgi:hypothetical protein